MSQWSEAALGEVAEIARSVVEPRDLPPETKYLGLEHLERGGRIIGVATVGSEEVSSSKFEFNAGDILYGKLRPYLGKIAAPEFAGVCSTDILPVRPGCHLERRYLLHYLRQPRMVELANSRATGANLPRLAPKELAKIQIPLPSLAEQKRIAAVLDQVDALRAKRREAITLLGVLAQSVFLDMFGDPASNPMGWEQRSFGELILDGPQNGLYKPAGDYGDGVPILRIDSFQAGDLKPSSQWRLVNASLLEQERYGLRESDIVINRVNSRSHLGKSVMVGEVPKGSVFESNMMRVRVDPSLARPVFVEQYLQSGFMRRRILESAKDAVNQSSINQQDVKVLPVFVPSMKNQCRFEESLEQIRGGQRKHRAHLATLEELFTSLQHRAFSGTLWDHEATGEAA
ncbi:restriction endonuclease subunit S [Streptomyces antibioticus]|uniref:restriction endonuclease subunit S n=1 Tax=Streptomyces antibioticus TaxID=1890 RepID=UPI0033F2DF5A